MMLSYSEAVVPRSKILANYPGSPFRIDRSTILVRSSRKTGAWKAELRRLNL